MTYDVIVVGGGASGMMAAITAKEQGHSVLLVERLEKLGKKILATGNGRCNLTNRHFDENSYRGNRPAFVYPMIEKFGTYELIAFFESMGMLMRELDGYYYPASLQASTVVDTLVGRIKYLGIEVVTEAEVTKVEKRKDLFYVTYQNQTVKSHQLILATGGCAQEKLGSNGSGYRLAKQLGHGKTDVFPALVGLESKESYFKLIAGVRNVSSIAVYANKTCIAKEIGEVQFTKYGLSGIPIFQVSRYAIDALRKKKKVKIVLDLLPDMITLEETMMCFRKQCSYKTMEEFLQGFLNIKLARCILLRNDINPNQPVKRSTKKQWGQILDTMKYFSVSIDGYKGFDLAQVTAGGVPTTEIIDGTLESKKLKGLYITGELLDVDGTCGGYNLQWAFTSGYIAGSQIT